MTLQERLTQTATFFREVECRGGHHLTAADEIMEALGRIAELEARIERLAGALEECLEHVEASVSLHLHDYGPTSGEKAMIERARRALSGEPTP